MRCTAEWLQALLPAFVLIGGCTAVLDLGSLQGADAGVTTDAGLSDGGPPPPDTGPMDAGTPDTGPPDAGPPDPPDAGCVPVPETCNGLDDDCDTIVDELCMCIGASTRLTPSACVFSHADLSTGSCDRLWDGDGLASGSPRRSGLTTSCASDGSSSFCSYDSASCGGAPACIQDVWIRFDMGAPVLVDRLRYASDWWNKRPRRWELWVSDDPTVRSTLAASGTGQEFPWRCQTGESCAPSAVPDECCPDGRSMPQDTRDLGSEFWAKWDEASFPEVAGRYWFFRVLDTYDTEFLHLYEVELHGCASFCESGFADCNMDEADLCEVSLGDDPSNCGGCGVTCASGTCVAGACGCAIASTTPARYATDAALDAVIEVTLECDVDAATVLAANVVVTGSVSGPIAGTVSSSAGNRLRFVPTGTYERGERITFNPFGVRSVRGDRVNALFQFDVVGGGTGSFTDSGQMIGAGQSREVDLGDLDGMPGLDALLGNVGGTATFVYVNDGSGTFSDGGSFGANYTLGGELGDLDGDGDLDAVMGNRDEPNTVWRNDGAGNFTAIGAGLGTAYTVSIALGDVDGDGDLDFVSGNAFGGGQPNFVFLNDGAGNFTDSGEVLGSGITFNVQLGDVDADGDLDILAANYGGGADRVFLNDGLGHFTPGGVGSTSRTMDQACGDLDGDGDLDCVNCHWNASLFFRTYINDGTGAFGLGQTISQATIGSSSSACRAIELADVDGNGTLDAVLFSDGGGWVLINDGAGRFSVGSMITAIAASDIAIADLDGDGTLDIMTATGGSERLHLGNPP